MDLLDALADRLDPPPDPYLNDPAGWVTTRLGEWFWSKQLEIAESLAVHRRTAVKACHGVGKSFSAARFIAWWLDVHPPGEAFVVSTAPTAKQVEAVLWREINKAAKKADPPLLGRVLTTEWKLGNELIGYGRKPADTDPTAFQGIHARYVLVIIDEACGIPKDLWIAAGALATNADCRILAIGNPDDPSSHFAEVCKPDSGWHVIRVNAFDSPNFTDEWIPDQLRPMLVSPIWVDEMRSDVGEGSAPWISKVLGDFPEDATDTVVSISGVRACQTPDREWTPEDLLPVELGVDVGGGGDMTVVRERRGVRAGRVWRAATPDSEDVVELVLAAMAEVGDVTAVKVDSVGIGWGVAGSLDKARREGKHQAHIVKVNVGEASTKPHRFPKLRDQIWWEIGHDLTRARAWDLTDCDDRTVADLTNPKWAPDASGRVQVEKKDDTRKRLGRSPDDADALLLAFYAAGDARHWMDAWKQMAAREDDTAPAESLEEATAATTARTTTRPRRECQHRWFAGTCVHCGNPEPTT